MNQKKQDKLYMEIAHVIGQNSNSKRFKCGAIIVKDDNILAFGYNGTPRGWDNTCEDSDFKTKREVLHAESNAIAKVARTTSSSEGSTLYVSLSPCYDCAKLIYQAGVVRVVYNEEYRSRDGIDFLLDCGVECEQREL